MGGNPIAYTFQGQGYPPQRVISVRTRSAVGSLPEVMGRTCAAITAYDNMDMLALNVETGVPVPAPLPGADDSQPGEIPGGRFATCTNVGPYDQIFRANEAISAMMGGQGLPPAGVAYIHYLNNPQVTPPESLETEVRFALANE